MKYFFRFSGSTINNFVRPPQTGQVVSAGTGDNQQPTNLIQQWGENIGNTLQQFNPLRPGSSAPVSSSSTAPGKNIIKKVFGYFNLHHFQQQMPLKWGSNESPRRKDFDGLHGEFLVANDISSNKLLGFM